MLSNIVESQIDVADLQDFLRPIDVAGITRDWRTLGLGETLVAFATDCVGNLFCFDVALAGEAGYDDPPVWFFDHDAGDSWITSPSFSEWIGQYAAIERPAAA